MEGKIGVRELEQGEKEEEGEMVKGRDLVGGRVFYFSSL